MTTKEFIYLVSSTETLLQARYSKQTIQSLQHPFLTTFSQRVPLKIGKPIVSIQVVLLS